MTKWKGAAASYAPALACAVPAAAFGAALFFAPSVVLAADECGVEAAGADTITCAAGNYAGPTAYPDFPAGIHYYDIGGGFPTDSDGLTLILNDPTITVGPVADFGVRIVSNSTTTNAVIINATNFGSVSTTNAGGHGIEAINYGFGDGIVTMDAGTVSTTGDTARGILGQVINTTSNANAAATLNGGSIATIGDSAHGVQGFNRGFGNATAIMTGGNVTTNGASAHGTYAYINNLTSTGLATATMSGGSVTTSGDAAHGLYASQEGLGDATATMTAGTISIGGIDSTGVYAKVEQATGTGLATATMNGGTVTATGDQSDGVVAQNNGTGDAIVTLNGGDVSTAGMGGHGVWANAANGAATATMNGGTIDTTGDAGRALEAQANGAGPATATLVDGAISTSGDGGHGVWALAGATNAAVATATISGGTVTTTGDNSQGLSVDHLGTGMALITMDGGTVTMSGANSDAILARAEGGSFDVNVNSGTLTGGIGQAAGIRTSAAAGGTVDIAAPVTVGAASGIAIRDGDLDHDGVDEIGGAVVVTTAGAVTGNAILGLGNDTFNLTGGSYAGTIIGDDATASANDGNDTFNWSAGTLAGGFSGQNGSDMALVTASEYDGSQVLDGGDDVSTADGWTDDLTIRGITATTNGANIANWEVATLDNTDLTISDGALTVGSDAGTGLFLTNGSDLDGLNAFALTGNMDIDATSSFIGTGAGAGVYSVSGDLVNAGLITMQDGAAGDVLSVGGDYIGNGGQLWIDTVLGADASPTDLLTVNGDTAGTTTLFVDNIGGTGAVTTTGIKLFDAGGAANGSFVLGAWDYTTTGGDNALLAGAFGYTLQQVGGDWYLQSQFSPAAPVYEAYPQVLLGLNGLPTLQQRVGNRHRQSEPMAPAEPEYVFCKDASRNFRCAVIGEQADYYADAEPRSTMSEGRAIWARIEAAHSHVEPWVSTTGAIYDLTRWKLQAGVDGLVHEGDQGQLIAALTAHYVRGAAQVFSAVGNGSIETSGYGIGAALTWYGDNGLYVDGQGQVNWYDSNLSSTVLGSLAKGNGGFGYALSLEAGKRIELGAGWSVTPQAQLAYSSVDFDSFTGPFGESVSLDRADSLKGRLGIAVEKQRSWRDEAGQTRQASLYGIVNLHREFMGSTQVDVSGTKLVSTADGWTGEIRVGGAYDWADNKYSVYGELNAATGLASFGNSYTVGGSVGLRVKW